MHTWIWIQAGSGSGLRFLAGSGFNEYESISLILTPLLLPVVRADDARLARSLSRSRPSERLRARASPFCMVECQEWGRHFLMLDRPVRCRSAAREKKDVIEVVVVLAAAAPLADVFAAVS